jgi:hypothetical protein
MVITVEPFAGMTSGEKLTVVPLGRPTVPNNPSPLPMLPLNPPNGAAVIVKVVLLPATTVAEAGAAVSEKLWMVSVKLAV